MSDLFIILLLLPTAKIRIKIRIKVSDLFIPLLPTAFNDAVGGFYFYGKIKGKE